MAIFFTMKMVFGTPLHKGSSNFTPQRKVIFYSADVVFLQSFIFLSTTFKLKIMSDISSRVKAIIVDKLGVDENEVVSEANFTNDLGADSLDTVELIMEFEKEFDIQIPDDQAENIATVGQAIQFIEQAQ